MRIRGNHLPKRCKILASICTPLLILLHCIAYGYFQSILHVAINIILLICFAYKSFQLFILSVLWLLNSKTHLHFNEAKHHVEWMHQLALLQTCSFSNNYLRWFYSLIHIFHCLALLRQINQCKGNRKKKVKAKGNEQACVKLNCKNGPSREGKGKRWWWLMRSFLALLQNAWSSQPFI